LHESSNRVQGEVGRMAIKDGAAANARLGSVGQVPGASLSDDSVIEMSKPSRGGDASLGSARCKGAADCETLPPAAERRELRRQGLRTRRIRYTEA